MFIKTLAKPRGIAIPNDLEVEVQSLVSKSKLVLRHSRHWLSHRQRKDSVMLMSMSKDYRNIIEGLQVSVCVLIDRLDPLNRNTGHAKYSSDRF